MNAGNGTHWRMPERHIRMVEEGDTIDLFNGRERKVTKVKRSRGGAKLVTFEDSHIIDVSLPMYDDTLVTVFRPRAKMRSGWRDPKAA